MLVGEVTGAQVLEADDRWRGAYGSAATTPEGARALAAVPTGAHLDVVFGMWCGDSVREVTKFLRYVERGSQPFSYRLIAVDRAKHAEGFTEGRDIRFVPTFIVMRDGREVGRVIESPRTELGADLASLLSGSASGPITGRAD
jgi:hypothetical protein